MGKPATFRLKVRHYEVDQYGHVNHAQYVHYLETARIEALEAEQARLYAQLEDSDLFRRDPVAFQTIMERLTALETELPAAYARWEELEQRQ